VLGGAARADLPGDADRLSLVAGLQLRQLLVVPVDQVGQPEEQRGALHRQQTGPLRRRQGGAGSRHRRVDVGLRRRADLVDHRAGRRVAGRDRGTPGLGPRTVDEQACCHPGASSASGGSEYRAVIGRGSCPLTHAG
jgi:hypothetical protein